MQNALSWFFAGQRSNQERFACPNNCLRTLVVCLTLLPTQIRIQIQIQLDLDGHSDTMEGREWWWHVQAGQKLFVNKFRVRMPGPESPGARQQLHCWHHRHLQVASSTPTHAPKCPHVCNRICSHIGLLLSLLLLSCCFRQFICISVAACRALSSAPIVNEIFSLVDHVNGSEKLTTHSLQERREHPLPVLRGVAYINNARHIHTSGQLPQHRNKASVKARNKEPNQRLSSAHRSPSCNPATFLPAADRWQTLMKCHYSLSGRQEYSVKMLEETFVKLISHSQCALLVKMSTRIWEKVYWKWAKAYKWNEYLST